MDDLTKELVYGLPDYRIYKLASKITVVSDKGTEIIIKEKHHASNGELILDSYMSANDIDRMIKEFIAKEVIITSGFYTMSKAKRLLSEI